MSTTVELVRANERYARLRAAVEELAAGWESDAAEHMDSFGQHLPCSVEVMAESLRDLLAAVDS